MDATIDFLGLFLQTVNECKWDNHGQKVKLVENATVPLNSVLNYMDTPELEWQTMKRPILSSQKK